MTTTTTMMMMTTTMTMTMTVVVRPEGAGERAGDGVVGRDTVPMAGTRARRTTQMTPIAATTTGGLNMVMVMWFRAGADTAGGTGTQAAIGLSCGTSLNGC